MTTNRKRQAHSSRDYINDDETKEVKNQNYIKKYKVNEDERIPGHGPPIEGGDDTHPISKIDDSRIKNCQRELHVVYEAGDSMWQHECTVAWDAVDDYDRKHPGKLPDEKKCGKFEQTSSKSKPKQIKDAINDLIVGEVKRLGYPSREHKVLVLDAFDLNTSTRLMKIGIKKISVPNPYECRYFNKIFAENPIMFDIINSIQLNLGDYIKDLIKIKKEGKYIQPFTAVWADYMGCYTGNRNKAQYPRKDIKALFDNGLMMIPSILAVTTSLRCGNKPYGKQLETFLKI